MEGEGKMKVSVKMGKTELGIRLDRNTLILVVCLHIGNFYHLIDFTYDRGYKTRLEIDLCCKLFGEYP